MAERVLIIDDDVDTLKLVGVMLQRQGYEILAASNGRQGLIQAEQELPDLILLDIMMPEIDGYEVARRLRANPDTASIPILMFTAKAQLDDKVTGFEVGADDYLTKPTHPTELIAHVKALLVRKGRATPATHAPGTGMRAVTIGVIAARGGMGATTVAANIASSLMLRTEQSVVVAEFCPGHGSLSLEMGLDSKPFMTLLALSPTEISRQKVMDALVEHPSGLRFLPMSYNPKDVDLTTQAIAQLEVIFTRLTGAARYVVIDLGFGLSTLAQKLLKMCSERIVIVEPMVNSLMRGRALIDEMVNLGMNELDIMVVSNNRVRADITIPWGNVQEQLGHPVVVNITPAPELHYQAERTKTTVVLSQPDGLTAQQYARLADQISNKHSSKAS